MLSKFLDPKNDLAFKRIFGSEKNKDILIHFLNDIFANIISPIQEVTFLKSALDPEVAAQRVSIVDLLCQDSHGDYFIVEMQANWESSFEKRAQLYAAKTYSQQLEKGVDYKDLKKVTFLAITDHTLFPEDDDYLSHHHILNIKNHKRRLKELAFCFLELSKFKKRKNELKSMAEKWAYFFKYAPTTREEDLKSIIGDDFIIQRAYEELNRFSWSTEELRGYQGVHMKRSADRATRNAIFEKGVEAGHNKGLAEGLAEGEAIGLNKGLAEGEAIGHNKGLAQGEEAGRHKEKLMLAKRLLSKELALDEVVEMTGLTLAQVEELASDLQQLSGMTPSEE